MVYSALPYVQFKGTLIVRTLATWLNSTGHLAKYSQCKSYRVVIWFAGTCQTRTRILFENFPPFLYALYEKFNLRLS